MKHLSLPPLLVAVLVQRICFYVGMNDGIENDLREVTLESADTRVIGVIGHHEPQYETPWSQVTNDKGDANLDAPSAKSLSHFSCHFLNVGSIGTGRTAIWPI